MTHQEFNHIYYTYTKDEKGLRYTSKFTLTGEELKDFVEHAIVCHEKNPVTLPM